MSLVVHSTDASFATDPASGLVLVDFWATWCGPCQVMLPRLDELATKTEGKAKIMKMDVDQNNETPSRFGIMSIPTIILFKDGQVVEKVVGTREVSELETMIAKHVA
ncbi:MAG: thioredoxin [Candidatus Gracilibacteria bacterium]|nr:thioredoxin [Candidatus Gracilibacteria bacterium]